MSADRASVIIRARNRVDSIGAAIESIRVQSVPVEIVVVDSGSVDGTLELARDRADVVVPLAPSAFTFGHALNVGADAAGGSILFALSAHCRADDPKWVERSLAHYEDPEVAGTCGLARDPSGRPMVAPRIVTFADVRRDPHWGFSNHASSWRRTAWEALPFDPGVASCEDKVWMWRTMLAGWNFVADPDLVVRSDHRRQAGLSALWKREYDEHAAITSRLDTPIQGWAGLLHEWWHLPAGTSTRPDWVRRCSPWRAVELLAGRVGDRAGASRRGPDTIRIPAWPEGQP